MALNLVQILKKKRVCAARLEVVLPQKVDFLDSFLLWRDFSRLGFERLTLVLAKRRLVHFELEIEERFFESMVVLGAKI